MPREPTSIRWARAQDSLVIAPDVAAVVSGGRWVAEGQTGFYRLNVRTRGANHSVFDLTIEWLAPPSPGQSPVVVRSVAVKELSGPARLDRPQIGAFQKGWRAWIEQTDPQSELGKHTTRAIDLGAPGVFQVRPAP